MTTQAFLGRCPSCKAHLHVAAHKTASEPTKYAPTGRVILQGRAAWEIESGALAGVKSPLAVPWNGRWAIDVDCPRCKARMSVYAVAGKTTEQKCGARCLASTRGVCECSCGGRNHGASHAV